MAASTALDGILKRTGLSNEQLRRAGVLCGNAPPPGPGTPTPKGDKQRANPISPELPPEVESMAARDFRCLPCKPRSKEATLKAWQANATTNLDTLRELARQRPGCNWALVADDHPILDVDDPAAFAQMEAEHGAVPRAPRIRTRRGFAIIFQAMPGHGFHPQQGCPVAGIDLTIGPHYQLFCGVHPSGHQYRIEDEDLPLPDAPKWLVEAIAAKQGSPAAQQDAPGAGAEVREPIGKGQRTNRLVSLAGSMHKRGMDPAAIEAALLEENARKCFPPLDEKKVRALAHDIPRRYANAKNESEESSILKPDLIRLADVEARPVDWMWEPYIPAGMLSMISGDPGAGKSFIALAVAADLTRGKLRDGRIVDPAGVLYLSVENPLAQSIRPRFDALGGDPALFFALRGTLFVEDGEEQRGAITLADIPILNEAFRQTGARLAVIDPIQSYFGMNVDLHRSNETRPVLDGLSKLAESHRCAILLLRHLSKQGSGKAITRGLGSIDLSGAVRSELLAGVMPDDENTRALVHIKSNVGRIGRTLGYAIDDEGWFSWTGESPITAADLLAPPQGPEQSAVERAKEWLAALLKSGSKGYAAIRDLAEDAGFKEKTIRRAKAALNIHSRKAAMAGGWVWSLPEDGPQDAADPDEGRLTV